MLFLYIVLILQFIYIYIYISSKTDLLSFKLQFPPFYDISMYNSTGYEYIVQNDKFLSVIFIYCFNFTIYIYIYIYIYRHEDRHDDIYIGMMIIYIYIYVYRHEDIQNI